MAAYTAVVSLLRTLDQPNISELFHGHTVEMLDSLRTTAEYFQDVLENASNEKIKSLDEKIRVVASEAEDVVEMKISEIIKGESWTFGILQHQDLLPVVAKMDTTKKQVMEIHDADQILELSGDSLIDSTSSTSYPMLKDDIVQGLDGDLEMIDKRLRGRKSDLDVVTISGMGGIGKTTLAKKAYDHLAIRYHFDIFVWVTISQEFQYRNVLLEALHCISKQKAKDYDEMKDNELADLVQKNLKGPRYLVVVDDIWSTDVWDSISQIFPNFNNGSRILLTTRETEVAMYATTSSVHEMKLLDLDNSWKLLRDKVFGLEHNHPPELEEIGKKIAGKCQGLPLIISVIAGHLSKTAKTLESWNYVAQTLSEIIASHPKKCLGVLGLIYHHLPNRLKPCFLSMGDFREDFQVDTRTLIQLWIAEGFIRTSAGSRKSLEEVAEHYLEDLISRNLIMARKRRFNGEVKVCGIHDLLREFCLIEAEVTKFMHVARTYPSLTKHNVRRFSIQKASSVEDTYKLLPPIARSMYYFSPVYLLRVKLLGILPIYRHEPIMHGFFLGSFNLLRVLAIFETYIRFDSLPLVIPKLFHLRYLQVPFFGSIPESISELQNLQTLISDDGYSDITFSRKIWMMKNLRYIRLGGATYVPSPGIESILNKNLVTGMPNLEEFCGLSYFSCTNEFFSGIPNLKRLIIRVPIRIEDHFPYDLLDMSSLRKFEAFKFHCKYLWKNPIKIFVFPTSLRRLSFTGCSTFIWEEISSTFIKLPNLEELKLKRCQVKDGVWRLSDKDKFESLKLLSLSNLNLKLWEASSDNFPNLKSLVLKNCEDLQEIPTDFVEIYTLESIELHDCSTTSEDSARNIEQEHDYIGNNILHPKHSQELKLILKDNLMLSSKLRSLYEVHIFRFYILIVC